jgi:DNA modification methylase
MALIDQKVTERWAAYCGDSCEAMPMIPSNSVGIIIESPPFGGLYEYSSSPRDVSNCKDYDSFLAHMEFIVREQERILKPGRLACIHCTDVPNAGRLIDLPGDLIRLYEKCGFWFHDRKCIWKEPLRVAIRTRALGLRHSQIVKDATVCRSAMGDYILAFRKRGENQEPVTHPTGFTHYAGELDREARERYCGLVMPPEGISYEKYKDHTDHQTNKWSQWIWQHYASSVWNDIRINNVVPYKTARENAEEKHPHPLQQDVIERCLQLWSNEGDVLWTSFAGVGSEMFCAVRNNRKAMGCELKPSYYRQLLANMELAETLPEADQSSLFDTDDDPEGDGEPE